MSIPGPQERHLPQGFPLPENFLDGLQQFVGGMASANFTVALASATALKVPAGTGDDVVAIGVFGHWRWNVADATAAHPGGAIGVYNVWVHTGPNVVDANPAPPPDEVDLTDRRFFLKILPVGGTPSGSGDETYYRQVGTCSWDGAKITGIDQLVPPKPFIPSGHFVGEIIEWPGLDLPVWPQETWGWADGSVLARGTYPELFAKITRSATVNFTSGSAVVPGFASTAGLAPGNAVESAKLPVGTVVASVDSPTQITVSAAATSSGAATITVFPWGNGNGSTTFNRPNPGGAPLSLLAEATLSTGLGNPGAGVQDVVLLTAPAFQSNGGQVRIEVGCADHNEFAWQLSFRRVVGGGAPYYVVDTVPPHPFTIYDSPPLGSCVYTLLGSSGNAPGGWHVGLQGYSGNGGREVKYQNTTIRVLAAGGVKSAVRLA